MYRFLLLFFLFFTSFLTHAAAPGNDDPCNATTLTSGATCNYTTYTNLTATATTGVTAPGCANYLGGDVWFNVVVSASGSLIIDTNTGGITDGGMALYTGPNCSTLTLIACDDDGSTNGLMPSISQTGLTPGSTVYIRFWEYGNNNNGTFSICVKDGTPCTSNNTNYTCASADPFCTGISNNFCNTIGVGSIGSNGIYGCLGSAPNPSFFFMNISTSGLLNFVISQETVAGVPIDVDFVLWGPFASQASMCSGITTSNIVDCNYSTSPVETATITNAIAGEWYMILITNFSNLQGAINFSQTNTNGAGAGATNCNILTANPSACSGGFYTLNGTLSVTSLPTTGTLTMTNSCGGSQILNAPFSNPIQYTIPNICGNGNNCSVTGVFSAAGSQNVLPANYTAPSCNILTVSPGVCNGSNQYVLSGTLTTGCLPTTGILTITNSCGGSAIYNAPFTSPLNWSLSASSGNGGSCTVTAVYSAAGAPTVTPLTFNEPTCCGANAGTINIAVTNGTNTLLPNGTTQVALCQNGTITLNSAGDYTLPTTPGCAGCTQELMYVIYSSAGPTGPNPSVDPNWTGYYWTGQDFPGGSTEGLNTNVSGDCSPILNLTPVAGHASINDPFNTLVFVPITADNGDNELIPNGIGFDTNGDGCYNIGDPISITYLNPIRISATPDCDGSVSLDINGGFPEYLNGLYTITNTGAGTLSSTLATAGGNVTISGLTTGQTYSLSVNDGSGCSTKTYSGVYNGAPIVTINPSKPTICIGDCSVLASTVTANVAGANTTFSNNNCGDIPDSGANTNIATGSWTTSAINITGHCGSNFTTGNVLSVCLDISHTYDADLNIFLQAPNGTIVELSSDNGGSGDNYTGTCFSMNAATSITSGTAPFGGSYLPEGNFSTFNGTPINGVWNLWVSDDLGGDIGTLLSWSITFANQNTYTYSWSPSLSGLNPSVCPVTTTTYTLTATNSCGCSTSESTTITVNTAPTVDAGIGGVICPGACINLSGSTNAVGSVNTPSFSNLNSYPIPDDTTLGVYSPIPVSGISPTTINASSIASVCVDLAHTRDGDLEFYLQCPDGTRIQLSSNHGGSGDNYTNTCFTPTAVIPISSGSSPFTGTFDPEDSFNVLNGCTANGTWQLFALDDAGGITGNITGWTITFNNNLPAFTWSPTTAMTNSTTLTPTVCPTSTTTYTLTANNGIGCTSADTVTVTVNVLAPPILTPIQPTCAVATGSVVITTVAGITFSFDGGAYSGTLIYGGLAAGSSHTVTAQNAAGCISAVSNITLNAQPPTPAPPILNLTQPTCTVATGTLTITAVAGITFSFDGGAYSGTLIYGGLAAGSSHTVTAQNAAGCISAISNITLNAQPTSIVPAFNAVGPICSGTVLSALPTTSTNGITGTWTPALNNTATTTYTFTPNTGQCATPATLTITVNENPTIYVHGTNPTCTTICDGSAIVDVVGGTGPYNYNWSNSGITQTITNLCIGTYSVTVTDSNTCSSSAIGTPLTGCFQIQSILVDSCSSPEWDQEMVFFQVGQSPLNTASLSVTWPNNTWKGLCTNPGFISSVNATITGGGVILPLPANGILPANANVVLITGTPASSSTSFANLSGTLYVLFQCSGNAAGHFANYNTPDGTRTLLLDFGSGCNDSVLYHIASLVSPTGSHTSSDGAFVNFSSSGVASYLNYGCTIPDSIQSYQVTLTAPTPTTPTFTSLGPYCQNEIPGLLPTSSTNGITGTWLPSTISTSTVGTQIYTFTPTPGLCATTTTMSITILALPTAPILTPTQPTCLVATGTVTITAVAGLTFSFDGGAYSGTLVYGGLAAGSSHAVFAQNAAGCISAISNITLNAQPATPATPILTPTHPTCLVATGSVSITAVAGITFSFDGGAYSGTLVYGGLAAGSSHTVFAQNAAGCISAGSNIILNAQPATPATPILTPTQPTCLVPTGTITITGVTGVSFSFDGGPYLGTLIYGGLAAGSTHTVTAQNAAGCISMVSTITLNALPAPPAAPTVLCYQTATWNPTTCVWDITGTQPLAPTVLCYQTATWNGTSCQYDITGTQPTAPTVLCYQTATWNPTTCLYDVTGTQLVPTFTQVAAICSGEFLSPLPTTSNNGITGTWFPPLNNTVTTTYHFSPTTTGQCASITPMTITVYSLPQVSSLAPLYYCDPNNDGFGVFDLTQVINTIPNGNTYTVSFHETITDATIDGTYIPDSLNYYNIDVNHQTIYVRVESNSSSSCYTILTLELIVNPTPEATEPEDYHVCDDNYDGFAIFNLTSTVSEVLGSINSTTHTISYFTTLFNAQSNSNPIINLSNFTNQTINTQTLWIRIENIATGCYDIETLQLFVDPLPQATQPNYPPYSLCDNTSPLGFEIFDLGSKIPEILIGQNGMSVTFFYNQADAFNDSDYTLPLLYTNASQYVQTIWIRVENINTGCFVLSTMDLRVEPLPSPIPPVKPYVVCDNNQDGYSEFDLNTLTFDILQGANYLISYHETNLDAQLGNNSLSSPYENINPFIQFIYVAAVDPITGCRTVIPVELNVEPSPIMPTVLPDLIQCDQDNNNQNLTMLFNLTQQTPIILAAQTSAANNYSVTYYTSLANAQSGLAPIIPTTTFTGYNNQTIWVRVENNITQCFAIGEFQLLVNRPLALTTPIPLSVCDSDANPNNLYTTFDLTIRNNSITQGQLGYTVTYYPSYPVTSTSIAIANPTSYTNTIPAVQTLGVMVTSPQGCKNYTTLDIRVLPIPNPNFTNIPPLPPQCDINNTGDMLEVFNLTVNAAYIINNDPNLTLHYYRTYNDALSRANEIVNPTAALVGQNIWIRVENTRVDYLGNHCFVLIEQPLRVNPLPTIIQPIPVVQNCDDNSDGFTVFDLTATTTSLLGNSQLSSDFTISYYTTVANAQFGINAITNASNYTNISNPQNIFIRVVNNITGCVNYNGQFTISVNPKPTAIAPTAFATCDDSNANDGFYTLDLNSYVAGIIGGQTGVITTFYDSQLNAQNGINAITNLTNYQAYTHILWVRVENATTGCYQLVSFNIIIEQLAEPIITAQSDTICVEWGTNTLLSGLTLNSGISNPNYTFEWSLNGSIIPFATNATYDITTVAPGNYTVVATSLNPPMLGCTSAISNTFTVIQSGPPQAVNPAYTVNNAFEENQTITINVVGFGIYEYSLDDGPFQSSNVFEYSTMGTHTVTIKDSNGNTSCGQITIQDIQTISYPHYFTPNGDGIHDTWNVVGLNQRNAKIYIFDRYGKLLKQISSIGEGWNGTYNGYLLPSTDYWFTAEYLEGTISKIFRAHFSLKR